VKRYQVPGTPDEAVRRMLDFLMEQGRIRGAFLLAETAPGRYSCSLITDRGLLDRAAPTAPVMPANAGKMVSRLTMPGPVPEPLAVVVRPCELRALLELSKLEQARLDNLLLVSLTCAGVAPTRALRGQMEPVLDRYREAAAAGANWEGMRDTCRVCGEFIPTAADVTLALVGGGGTTALLARTEKGARFLDGLAPADGGKLDSGPLERLAGERAGQRPAVLDRFAPEKLGLAGLVTLFGRCINCHACSNACPVCYCSACHFESADAEPRPDDTADELERRGGLRLPSGTVYYHVGRMLHVSTSCVGCGMCSDACPVDIPVASIFTRLASSVQGMFDYVAGRDAGEKMPTSTFETEELEEIGA
jgi:formate dehydrogenase subunit beta